MKLALAIVATLVACKSKKAEAPPSAQGSQTAPAPPAQRPSQQPLPQLPPLELADDAKRAQKIDLGHALFFDPQLSANKDRACYSCHKNEDGTGGHDPIAIGSGDKKQTRHAPVLWNVAYLQGAFYWDGRAKSLEENAAAAWAGGNMGVGKENIDKKAAELAGKPEYKKKFEAAFGAVPIKAEHVAQALAEYERTMICKDTAYDKFAAGDKAALSEAQQRGLDTFLGKGQCVVCHTPPFFSTAMTTAGGAFFNTGIGTQGPEDQVDIGRMKVTNDARDWAAFKPPTLRNVSKTAPYFHDGSVAALDAAVKLMASGGINNKNKNPILGDRALSEPELADLIAFLGGLDCPGKLEEPKAPGK